MEKKFRIGIFGGCRGGYMARIFKAVGAEIVAVCDHNPWYRDECMDYLSENGKTYADFDEFIEHDMDGVYLANYFEQHAPYAIRLLDRGISVCSETMCASTMKWAVELARAVERNRGRAVYMFGENYQFQPVCQEMRRIYQTGSLGELMYAHGEYVHPSTPLERCHLAPGPHHWRNFLSSTYYNSHSLAPLMYVTDTMPKTVTARSVHVDEYHKGTARQLDPCGIMMTEMDNGAVFTTCGCMSASAHSIWYRFSCYRGTMETQRYDTGTLELRYTNYGCPEGQESFQRYVPEPPYDAEQCRSAGHGGGDYYVIREFLRALETGEESYFDVYRGLAMSAVAILGWRSCLDGKTYAIPDFRQEEVRRQWENDVLTPFPDRDGNRLMPSTVKPGWKIDPADQAAAEKVWRDADRFIEYAWPKE